MRRNKLLVKVLFLIAAAVLAFSCSSGSRAEKKEVLDTVKRYNGLMRRAYMEANLNHMANVATEKQISKMFPTFAALRAEGSFMMAEQKVFEVKRVSVKDNMGLVETEEEWVFWWQNKDTMEVTRPEEKIAYKMRYNLLKEDNSWKVDGLEDIE